MTSNMPIQTSAPGLCRTLLSTFQPVDITLINDGRLSPNLVVDGVRSLALGGYAGIQNIVNYITASCPGPDGGIPEQPVLLQTQTADPGQVASSSRNDVDILERRLHNHNHNNSESFLSEAEDMEEAGNPATHEDQSSDTATIAQTKRPWMLITVLIVGVLSLVVVPGLVVGVITGQIPWGIALAGATATILSFLAGLYYHHNK